MDYSIFSAQIEGNGKKALVKNLSLTLPSLEFEVSKKNRPSVAEILFSSPFCKEFPIIIKAERQKIIVKTKIMYPQETFYNLEFQGHVFLRIHFIDFL